MLYWLSWQWAVTFCHVFVFLFHTATCQCCVCIYAHSSEFLMTHNKFQKWFWQWSEIKSNQIWILILFLKVDFLKLPTYHRAYSIPIYCNILNHNLYHDIDSCLHTAPVSRSSVLDDLHCVLSLNADRSHYTTYCTVYRCNVTFTASVKQFGFPWSRQHVPSLDCMTVSHVIESDAAPGTTFLKINASNHAWL